PRRQSLSNSGFSRVCRSMMPRPYSAFRAAAPEGSGCLPGPGCAGRWRRWARAKGEKPAPTIWKILAVFRLHVALSGEAAIRHGTCPAEESHMSEPSLPQESIFLEALEIASAPERALFLDRACGGQGELRAEVEALLRAHAQ